MCPDLPNERKMKRKWDGGAGKGKGENEGAHLEKDKKPKNERGTDPKDKHNGGWDT
jgi:hypothetical protein